MKINVVARSVQCGHMITILTGKTPGSTYMAGVVDNIRKEVMRHHILGNSDKTLELMEIICRQT